MEKAIAIDTCLGILNGRDCVYLDQMKRDDLDNLTFTGDINGHLISRHRDEKRWLENMTGSGHLDNSSFDLSWTVRPMPKPSTNFSLTLPIM